MTYTTRKWDELFMTAWFTSMSMSLPIMTLGEGDHSSCSKAGNAN
jgi:hypothetical protein